MVNLYIDESGSITQTNTEHNKYFVIGIVVPRDTDRVRKLYSQFVERNLSRMRALEKAHAIFDTNGKFKELKGNAFDATLKERFLNHFCRFDALRVFYIQVDNRGLSDVFCENKARAFNFLLKSFLVWRFNNGAPQENYEIQIDERNVKTEAKFTLEDYLNTELRLQHNIKASFSVRYFDSSQNKLIQVADVFSNIFFSYLHHRTHEELLKSLMRSGYINPLFAFPLSYNREERFTETQTIDIISEQ